MCAASQGATDRRKLARTAALVGDLEAIADAKRERRAVIEEERCDVIVVDEDRGIGRPDLSGRHASRLIFGRDE